MDGIWLLQKMLCQLRLLGCLVASGITFSAVKANEVKYGHQLLNVLHTLGVAGIYMAEPMPKKLYCNCWRFRCTKAQLNLMGWDMLYRGNAYIHCLPDRVFLAIPDDLQSRHFLLPTIVCLYCQILPILDVQHIFKVSNFQKLWKHCQLVHHWRVLWDQSSIIIVQQH